jgi:hypothetical protein
MTERPISPTNPSHQHRLKGDLGLRDVRGKTLDQW